MKVRDLFLGRGPSRLMKPYGTTSVSFMRSRSLLDDGSFGLSLSGSSLRPCRRRGQRKPHRRLWQSRVIRLMLVGCERHAIFNCPESIMVLAFCYP